MDFDMNSWETSPLHARKEQNSLNSQSREVTPNSHLFNNADFGNLKNINNLIGNSCTTTPTRRIISTSKTSSEVNSDSVYNTPTKISTEHKFTLQSPSRGSVRSHRHTRHKYLLDNHYHRKLRNQPSKLDMLDSEFTSFPIDPPKSDTSPTHDPDSSQNKTKKSMVIVEDYIDDTKKAFNFHPRKTKKISVLDFKRSLREQQQFGFSPSSSIAFSSASTLLRARRDGSEIDTIGSQHSIGHRSLAMSAHNALGSTFSSTSTVQDESVAGFVNPVLSETSPTTTATEIDNENINEKRCVNCEIELAEIPVSSTFKELVCFDCNEKYDHIVNLINSDVHVKENDDMDDEDEMNVDEFAGARPMSIADNFSQPSFKRQCNDFDNVLENDFESTHEDNFAKIYKSLKKIQDNNNRLLLESRRKKRIHNPLLRVALPEPQPTSLKFDFSGISTPTLGSPRKTHQQSKAMFSIDNLKETLEKFRRLTLKNGAESDLNNESWVRAKRKFNWFRANQENVSPEADDNERYMMWS